MPNPRKMRPRKDRAPHSARRTVGRPQLDSPDILLQIWTYVEVQRRRTGLSVHAICAQAPLLFLTIGRVPNSVPLVNRALRGDTLHRRYYAAKCLLQKHIDEHADAVQYFHRRGAKVDFLGEICEVEAYWRRVLDYELAAEI